KCHVERALHRPTLAVEPEQLLDAPLGVVEPSLGAPRERDTLLQQRERTLEREMPALELRDDFCEPRGRRLEARRLARLGGGFTSGLRHGCARSWGRSRPRARAARSLAPRGRVVAASPGFAHRSIDRPIRWTPCARHPPSSVCCS